MDIFKIISFSNPWYWVFMISWGIFLIIFVLNQAKLIGKAGEKYVRKELKLLDNTKYKVLNDIMIENKNGKYGPFYGCSNYPNCRYVGNKEKIIKK